MQIESDGKAALLNDVNAISAAAKGDITLAKNDDADFRIGSIVSTTGDVTLKAKGKFVDALDKKRDNADTQANELVKSWVDMGLIAGAADYKGAYINRLEKDRDNYKSDVTEQFAEYQATYQSTLDDYNALEDKTGVTAPEKSERLELLDKKFSKYETADAYLAADTDYQTLVSTAENPQYQWTEEDLLSGIRSAIVNKEEGTSSEVTHLKDANITAQNVTLTGAGVGTNSKDVTTVNLSEIIRKDNETPEESNARLEALSKLANAEAADVKINYVLDADGKPVTHTITRVNYRYDADNGYYTDGAGKYIRYRKDADGNLLKYTYTKDADNNFTQSGDAVAVSDFSDVIDSPTTIKNKEIKSFDISGTIPLGINATGNITVKTTGNEGNYIVGRNKGVKIDAETNPNSDNFSALNIVSVETSKADGNYGDVRIISEKGIFNANSDASAANVIGKDLVLVGGNDAIGTTDKPLTVKLTGDLLSARSNDEINLKKVGADDFRVSAVYSQKAIRITNDGNGIIQRSLRFDDIAEAYLNTPGEITLTGSAGTASSPMYILPHDTAILNLKGDGDFYIKGVNDASKSVTNGTITLNDISGNIDISSEGSINQTADGTNDLTSIKVAANGDVILGGNNKLSAINVGTIGGNFELNNDSDKVTVTFNDKVTEGIKITQRNAIELAGSIEAKSIDMTSREGSLESIGGLKTTLTTDSSISLSATNLKHEGEVITEKLTLATDKDAIFTNKESTFSELTVSSRDGNAINGSVEVTTKTDTFTADINNDVTGDLKLINTKDSGAISFGGKESLTVGGDFLLNASSDINYGSTVSAGKDISIKAQNLYRKPNTAGYFSTAGNIELNVSKNIGTADSPILIGNIDSKSLGVDLYKGGGYLKGLNAGILTLGEITTDADLNISSEGSIAQADGKKISVNRIEFAAANEINLENSGNSFKTIALNTFNDKKATGSVKINNLSTDNTLTVEGDLKAAGDVAINTYEALSLNGNIESDKNVDLTAGGDIRSSDDTALKAGEQVALNATNNISLSGEVSAAKVAATMGKSLDMRNDDNAIDTLEVGSGSKNNINGSVLVTTNADEFIALLKNNVVNDITLTNKKTDGLITLQNEDNNYLRSMNGSVTLDMDGSFLRGKPIWAKKDINITSHNGTILILNFSSETNNQTLNAMQNVTLNAEDAISIDGKINAGNNITAHSNEGEINIVGSVQAKNDIDLTTNKGNIIIGSDTPKAYTVIADGNINIKTNDGIVTISGKTKSKKKLEIGTNQIQTNEGKRVLSSFVGLSAASESTERTKEPGDITINAELEADNSIVITTDDGDIDITKKILVTNGDITITTSNGDIRIYDNGAEDMLSAQNNLELETNNGGITISGRISTQDGDITITSDHDSYIEGQKGITVERINGINPGRNLYLNAINGDIEFKKISAQNVDINTINGDVTGNSINANELIHIELVNGELYLDLAKGKGVVILTGDGSESNVKTIKADSVTVDKNLVQVGNTISRNGGSGATRTTPASNVINNRYSNVYSNLYSNNLTNRYSDYSNIYRDSLTSNRNTFATLGTALTRTGSTGLTGLTGLTGSTALTTYWQDANSATAADYSFNEFDSTANDISYRLTRNYFEVRFIPTWLEEEFMNIDFDYRLDDFGIRNANEDELTID